MSMAGGWFFLTVNEAFTLGDRDFRLPGVGSYMAVAIEKGDQKAMLWAIVAMSAMIVAVDQLLWKPLAAWSQRFRLEDLASSDKPKSWVLDLVRRSPLVRRLGQQRRRLAKPRVTEPAPEARAAAAGCSDPHATWPPRSAGFGGGVMSAGLSKLS